MNYTIFCEISFLNTFFENRPREGSDSILSDNKATDTWKKYKNMFFSNANLCLNCSFSEFNQQQNPFFDMIKKKKGEGEIKIKFDKFPINFNDINKHAIFFLIDEKQCCRFEEEHGMLFVSNEKLDEKAKFLFSVDRFRKIDTKTDWQTLKDFKHPCNFILLVDKFIFKNIQDTTNNLKSLFDALLPDIIQEKFIIKILTEKPKSNLDKDNHEKNDWLEKSSNELEEAIKKIAKEVRLNIDFNVSIRFIEYSEHDRHIVTNYCWFSCGYGFVLTYNERCKGTDVHIHQITAPNVYERMREIIDKSSI